MKLLLDECLPRKFKNHLPGHECYTVPEIGWAGKKNGELLLLAEKSGFEIFLTLDQGMEYEQNLMGREIGVNHCVRQIQPPSRSCASNSSHSYCPSLGPEWSACPPA
jgi:hypothetical protein